MAKSEKITVKNINVLGKIENVIPAHEITGENDSKIQVVGKMTVKVHGQEPYTVNMSELPVTPDSGMVVMVELKKDYTDPKNVITSFVGVKAVKIAEVKKSSEVTDKWIEENKGNALSLESAKKIVIVEATALFIKGEDSSKLTAIMKKLNKALEAVSIVNIWAETTLEALTKNKKVAYVKFENGKLWLPTEKSGITIKQVGKASLEALTEVITGK